MATKRSGSSQLNWLALAVCAVGVVLVAIGIIYVAVPAESIHVLPGHVAGNHHHHTRRGTGVLVIGGVVLLFGLVMWYRLFRRRTNVY